MTLPFAGMRLSLLRSGYQPDMEGNMIAYTEEKKFSKEKVQELFLSVGWISGQYPARLHKALMNSSTVLTA